MADRDKHCKNCEFFDRHGKCRRYPPKVFAFGEAENLKFIRHLPDVTANEFCGEFKPKE
jgi:hypothetical protein